MDEMNAALDRARSELGSRIEALKATTEMSEVLRYLKAANSLEEFLGRPLTSLGSILGLSEGDLASARPTAAPRAMLEKWEFTGKKPLEAAKIYLKKAGQPKSINEIVQAINSHGGNAGSVEHLKTSLTRATLEVVKVNDDMYGLLEHFPHIKRSGRPKKGPVSMNPADFTEDGEEEAGETDTE